ncbi:MAG: sulfatase-like hydrolase/transferase [Chloroflexi bacterium]|nr:sulfatase-like hydrolase/transferase [Chloroflexota bacterium]
MASSGVHLMCPNRQPEPLRAAKNAPNVLYIVLDDTGFGQLGCYGSPINTPNIDALAENGLRYNNMHTTALCSPSRTCMLTGRNHHSNAMACITEGSTGYPGSNGNIPFENGFLSEMLLQHGYNTYAIGKWHLTPADQISAAGPYDRWPLGDVVLNASTASSAAKRINITQSLSTTTTKSNPKTPEEGYHITEDLVDKAVSLIADAKQVAPDKPFFMYFCTGAITLLITCAKSGRISTRKFDDGWEAYRQKHLPNKRDGHSPARCRTVAP